MIDPNDPKKFEEIKALLDNAIAPYSMTSSMISAFFGCFTYSMKSPRERFLSLFKGKEGEKFQCRSIYTATDGTKNAIVHYAAAAGLDSLFTEECFRISSGCIKPFTCRNNDNVTPEIVAAFNGQMAVLKNLYHLLRAVNEDEFLSVLRGRVTVRHALLYCYLRTLKENNLPINEAAVLAVQSEQTLIEAITALQQKHDILPKTSMMVSEDCTSLMTFAVQSRDLCRVENTTNVGSRFQFRPLMASDLRELSKTVYTPTGIVGESQSMLKERPKLT